MNHTEVYNHAIALSNKLKLLNVQLKFHTYLLHVCLSMTNYEV